MRSLDSDYTLGRIVFWVLASIAVGVATFLLGESVGTSVVIGLIFAAVVFGTYDLVVLVVHGEHLHTSRR